jgi:hypothetical protein
MNYAQNLLRDGVVVVPAFTPDDIQLYHTAFWEIVRNFPEYISPENRNTIYVQGAFGALGNPASFHNPVVRNIRTNMMFRAVPLFSPISNGKKLEQLIDRMSIRRQGTSLGKETWHRDQAPTLTGDHIFGGWVNLDIKHEQRFSCIPGSHIVRSKPSGFIRETLVDESQKRIYTVPPGHWIVFFQNILHEVLPGKILFDSIRLYLGWRLTDVDEPLYNQESALQNQGIPFGPSGQIAPMYSPNHLSFHSRNLISWSQSTFKLVCLEIKDTPKLGQFIVVHKNMRSLKQYGFPLYSKYSPEELSILRPNRKWQIANQELHM